MIVIITLFYLSLLVVGGMITKKFLEIRPLKLSVIEGIEKEFQGKLYEVMHEFWYTTCVNAFVHARAFAIRALRVSEHAVLGLVLRIADRLRKRHRKLYDLVKGRGAIRNKGSVSFFLQEVSAYKKTEASREE